MISMEDPYIYAESLDAKTISYARKQTEAFQAEYGRRSSVIRSGVSDIYMKKRIIEVKLTARGMLLSYFENGKYHLSLDGNELYSTENLIFQIHSDPGGERFALFETGGSDRGTLSIIENGQVIRKIAGTIRDFAFTKDSYYVVRGYPGQQPPDGGEQNSERVLLGDGKVVFGKGLGPEDFISLTRSGDMIFATVGNWSRGSVYLGALEDPGSWKKVKEVEHEISPVGIRNGKPYYFEHIGNGEVTSDGGTVIRFTSSVESVLMVESGFLALKMEDAKTVPALYSFEGEEKAVFKLDSPMGLKSLDSDGKDAIMALESFGIPYSIYRFSSGLLERVEESRILDLEISEKWVQSTGAKVHYFLVKLKSGDKRSALAYGYGGFNIPVVPMFYPAFSYLLSQGVVLAVSNLRGGNEYGEEWHRDGMLHRKQNVFNDFRAIISSLREEGRKVVAMGISNGGLLVGATMTQAPEVLDGAVIGNPVLDMMRYHRMSVGMHWISEFGDPDREEDRDYLLTYSPYHNISGKDYPKALIYTRLKDDRVHPAHAIKFHLALREKGKDAYLRANVDGGHIGLTPDESISEISDICSFVLGCLSED